MKIIVTVQNWEVSLVLGQSGVELICSNLVSRYAFFYRKFWNLFLLCINAPGYSISSTEINILANLGIQLGITFS